MQEKLFKKTKIIKNKEVLKETYIPKGEELLYRDSEIKELAAYLSYALDNVEPPHILVLGPKGTGKTAIVKYLLSELRYICEQETKRIYLCYALRPETACQALVSLASSINISLPRRGTSFIDLVERWENFAKESISIMVIDELDALPEKDLHELLFHFTRREKTSVIGISQLVTIRDKIRDPSVQSSFIPRIIHLSSYTPNQLEGILQKRAKAAFYPGVVDDAAISLCAALAAQAGGDCRYALTLLRFGADRGVIDGSNKIKEKHIREAQKDVEELYIYEGISKLKTPHKYLLCEVSIADRELKNLFDYYNKTAPSLSLTTRRLSDYLHELEKAGYLAIDRISMGKGKGVKWHVRLTVDRKILQHQLGKDLECKEYLEARALLKI